MFRPVVRPVRVWLEPDYDHGRCGVWLLDWPGAFAWHTSREVALDRVPSVVSRFHRWLEANGEPSEAPAYADAALVEEVAARRLEDGYEVNATFQADRRPVDEAEVERAIRWLGFARRDLLAVAAGATELERQGRALALEARTEDALASGAAPGREADAVLRHVAGAEAWFATRLDPQARYTGPATETGVAEHLAGTRAWLERTLRELVRREPAIARHDSKGEEWTLAKLLRRAVYHSRDHWDELDRRLAHAERRADRLELRHRAPFDAAELRRLFGDVGLFHRTRLSDSQMQQLVDGSTDTVGAWDGDVLVGFGALISDEITNAYISTLAVAPDWQERGVGGRLMDELLRDRPAVKVSLDSRPSSFDFYIRRGFRRADDGVVVRPRPPGWPTDLTR